MKKYWDAFLNSFTGTVDWTWRSIVFDVPWYLNYFWGLVIISLAIWALELFFPWRRQQAVFRKDFWLDAFYMFFNFFIFAIVISGFYKIISLATGEMGVTAKSLELVDISGWSPLMQLLLFFVVLDFVQWFTHILLHRYNFLWKFHQVHHSVKEMGFAAHLRYHWMENVLYKPLKTVGVMVLGGFEPEQAYMVHFFAIAIGHINHSNLKISYGPFKYVFNNPVMHLYHHAYEIPKGRYGINFGINLSLWDYVFGTAHVPEDSGNVPLGFPGDQEVPKGFFGQLVYGFKNQKKQ